MKTKVLASFVVIGCLGFGLFSCSIWRSPKHFANLSSCADTAVLTMKEYDKLVETHRRPYVFIAQSKGQGNVLVYGSEHTKDPNNKQIKDIEEQWNKFKPTIALVEGRLGFLMKPFMNPVKAYGESGWVANLAKRDNVKLYSWEPLVDSINSAMKKRYAAEKLALGGILNPYFSNLRFGKPVSPEKYVEDGLDRAAEFDVQEKFKSYKDVDAYWKLYFPNGPDWRDVSDQWGLPGYLGQVADERNMIRNIHLTCIIQVLVSNGERVFVVAGSSHAVCIELALAKSISNK
jgi:hypothetical protein